ncbi:hypothetical protein SCUP234_10529 [Seiridium cupressi]
MAEFPSRPPLEVWDTASRDLAVGTAWWLCDIWRILCTASPQGAQGASPTPDSSQVRRRIGSRSDASGLNDDRPGQGVGGIPMPSERWRWRKPVLALARSLGARALLVGAGCRGRLNDSSLRSQSQAIKVCFDVLDEPEIAPLGTDLLCISDGEDPQIDPPTEKCLFAIAIAASRNNT